MDYETIHSEKKQRNNIMWIISWQSWASKAIVQWQERNFKWYCEENRTCLDACYTLKIWLLSCEAIACTLHIALIHSFIHSFITIILMLHKPVNYYRMIIIKHPGLGFFRVITIIKLTLIFIHNIIIYVMQCLGISCLFWLVKFFVWYFICFDEGVIYIKSNNNSVYANSSIQKFYI